MEPDAGHSQSGSRRACQASGQTRSTFPGIDAYRPESSTQAKKSFDLGEQLEFQRSFLHIITVVAERYGAHIAGFEGDGALVVLGFAHAMEDAAESAVRMGLDFFEGV